MEKIHDQGDDDGTDEVLAKNFTQLLGSMSVGKLREDMGGIGTSAIQAAKRGSKGLRLATLEKFAAYFNVQPYQMLLPDLGRYERPDEQWPFALLTPDQVKTLPPEHLATVEKVALDLLSAIKVPSPAENPRTDTVPKPGQLKTLSFTVNRKKRSGTGISTKVHPRKSGGG